MAKLYQYFGIGDQPLYMLFFVVLLTVPTYNFATLVTVDPEIRWLTGVSLELDAIMIQLIKIER